MNGKQIVSVVALILFAGFGFAADTYVTDPVHSNVVFTVQHLVVSKVSGRFKEFSATLVYDDSDLSKSSLTGMIKTASISTDNDKRDGHLRSADFFDAEKYPEITFQSKKVEKEGDEIRVSGALTIRGVSKDVTFPVTIAGPIKDPRGNSRLGVEASLKINRMDFGVAWNNPLEGGGVVVGNDVWITINGELAKEVPKQ